MTALSEGNMQANGITIHYYCTGDDKKPSILLLHGMTDSGQCWPRVAADLEGSYDVIMTDARGHGHSGTSADFSIALLAEDAAAVVRELGLEKPYVWGHSMGAITAATLAAAYPDLVRAVLLEDPPLRDQPLFQTAPDKEIFQRGGEQQEQYGGLWLFKLRVLPREDRIANGVALKHNCAKEHISHSADPNTGLNITDLVHAFLAVAT